MQLAVQRNFLSSFYIPFPTLLPRPSKVRYVLIYVDYNLAATASTMGPLQYHHFVSAVLWLTTATSVILRAISGFLSFNRTGELCRARKLETGPEAAL